MINVYIYYQQDILIRYRLILILMRYFDKLDDKNSTTTQ